MNRLSYSFFQEIKIERLLLCLLLLWSSFCLAQGEKKMTKEIEKLIQLEPTLQLDEIPGYIIGIIQKDSSYTYSHGAAQVNVAGPPNPQSIFELGGVTKIFTASLLEILANENLIDLNSLLNSYLPIPYRNPRLDQLRLIDLVAHSSGLPKMPTEFGAQESAPNNPYRNYSKEDLAIFFRDFIPEDGEAEYAYSHVNYALLEIAIEFKLQKSFEALMNEKVLVPLGLEKSFMRSKDSLQVIQGHSIGGQVSKPWDFPSFAGSEGMKSCLEDLMRFAQVNLTPTAHPLSPILQKTHKELQVTDYSKNVFAAKGWHRLQRKKFNILIHTGNTSGFRSFLGIIPETKTAVVVLSNSKRATGGLGFLLLRMINYNWNKRKAKRK